MESMKASCARPVASAAPNSTGMPALEVGAPSVSPKRTSTIRATQQRRPTTILAEKKKAVPLKGHHLGRLVEGKSGENPPSIVGKRSQARHMDGVSLNPLSHVPLANGVLMPVIGMGLSHNQGGFNPEAVDTAIRSGVRLFDTAKRYGTESPMGEAWKRSGVAREEFFFTSKLWPGKRPLLASSSAL